MRLLPDNKQDERMRRFDATDKRTPVALALALGLVCSAGAYFSNPDAQWAFGSASAISSDGAASAGTTSASTSTSTGASESTTKAESYDLFSGRSKSAAHVEREETKAVDGIASVYIAGSDEYEAADGNSSGLVAQTSKSANQKATEALGATVSALVDTLAQERQITATVAYIDVNSGASFSVGGSTPMVSASSIKLFVAAAVLEDVQSGTRALTDTVRVQSSDIVGGAGSIQSTGAGTYTLDTLMQKMISESDNTAANVLVNLVGIDRVNEAATNLGCTSTTLRNLFMQTVSTTATATGEEALYNATSADDQARALQAICAGTFVNETSSGYMMELLEAQQVTSGIQQGVPTGVVVAHKTGTNDGIENDAAIVEDEVPYILVVMTEGQGQDSTNLINAIAEISTAVYEGRQAE